MLAGETSGNRLLMAAYAAILAEAQAAKAFQIKHQSWEWELMGPEAAEVDE